MSARWITTCIALAALTAQGYCSERYEGKLVTKDARTFFGPSVSINLAGWNMDRSGAQLSFLAKEGTWVHKGDLLASFASEFNRLEDHVLKNLERQKADKVIKAGRLKAELDGFLLDLQQTQVRRQKLTLDLQKRGLISERDFALLQADAAIAAFEAKAMEQKIAIYRQYIAQTEAFHDRSIALWEGSQRYIASVKASHELRSPGEGYVSLPPLPHRRMKAEVGKWVMSGWAFLKLALSREKLVEFAVPEADFPQLKQGMPLLLKLGSQGRIEARLKSINEFPVERGFLEDDFSTPYAAEKVFQAVAEPLKPVEAIAGTAVEVELP